MESWPTMECLLLQSPTEAVLTSSSYGSQDKCTNSWYKHAREQISMASHCDVSSPPLTCHTRLVDLWCSSWTIEDIASEYAKLFKIPAASQSAAPSPPLFRGTLQAWTLAIHVRRSKTAFSVCRHQPTVSRGVDNVGYVCTIKVGYPPDAGTNLPSR